MLKCWNSTVRSFLTPSASTYLTTSLLRALADFKEQYYVFVDLAAGVDEELDRPDPPVADWENELDALYSLTR